MKTGPKDEKEQLIFSIENLRFDVQHEIHKAMERAGLSQRQLAERLGVSEARVSQLFSSTNNPTIVVLGKIFHALRHRLAVAAVADDSIAAPKQPVGRWVAPAVDGKPKKRAKGRAPLPLRVAFDAKKKKKRAYEHEPQDLPGDSTKAA